MFQDVNVVRLIQLKRSATLICWLSCAVPVSHHLEH